MHQLILPVGFPLPTMDRSVDDADKMFRDDDHFHYASVGLSALRVIEQALDGALPRSILDLPSGFGRVTRVLRARFPGATITASDLDADGIAFCAARLGVRPALSVRDFTTLRLGETYDLIWVGSLITHLPARQVKLFLAAMARHMTRRSVLVASSHGPGIIPRLREIGYGLADGDPAGVIDDYERTGFGYRDYGGGPDYGVALSNEHYGISLIDQAWLGATLTACGLRMAAYHPRAWDDHHDVVVAYPQRRTVGWRQVRSFLGVSRQ